jgi:predicted ester cyclase
MDRRTMLARAADILAAWNRQDPQGIGVNMVEDVMWRDVALGKPLQGREALVTAARNYMIAFPDLRIQETSSTLAGMRLAQELTVVGTHQGTLLGVEPTGRWTETYAAVITTFDEDGMVIEGALYWSPLAMFQQLGILAGLAPVTV